MLSLEQQFAEWVGKQDSDATFNPRDCEGCVGYQFLKAHEFPVAECGVWSWTDTAGDSHDLPPEIADAIVWAIDQCPRPASFGALASRLAA